MTEAKSKEMRDIRSDLQDRADLLRQQLRTEQAQFELLVAQLKREQSNRIDDLRTQFEAATKLLQVANWYYNVRMAVARSLALAAAAEIAAHQFLMPKTVQYSQAQGGGGSTGQGGYGGSTHGSGGGGQGAGGGGGNDTSSAASGR